MSPHLDDAILSCGTYIYKSIKNKTKVLIATVFSGLLDAQYLSPLAKWFHGLCDLDDFAMKTRCIEDINACSFLKANNIHFDLHECLYRLKVDGSPKYIHEQDIYSADITLEMDTVNEVISTFLKSINLNDYDEIYIPLGIGRHIDHLILRVAVETIVNEYYQSTIVKYYEDIPYVCSNKDVNWEMELTKSLRPYYYIINKEEFEIYIKTISMYKSQTCMIWKDNREMVQQLKRYFYNYKIGKLAGKIWAKSD